MTSTFSHEAVEIRAPEARPLEPPPYVYYCLGYWGWYMRSLKGPNLGYPKENILNRVRREREGAVYYGGEHDNLEHYGLFYDIDVEIESLRLLKPTGEEGQKLVDAILWIYWQAMDRKATAKELGMDYTKFNRMLSNVHWYLAGRLTKHYKRLQNLQVIY